ncbi:hypothetical protein BC835DRAFT_202931 [Cytidiella melzeri]|nr:hypothetical protein BC835DRAFT_202931 [Cytidiella melzeri]
MRKIEVSAAPAARKPHDAQGIGSESAGTHNSPASSESKQCKTDETTSTPAVTRDHGSLVGAVSRLRDFTQDELAPQGARKIRSTCATVPEPQQTHEPPALSESKRVKTDEATTTPAVTRNYGEKPFVGLLAEAKREELASQVARKICNARTTVPEPQETHDPPALPNSRQSKIDEPTASTTTVVTPLDRKVDTAPRCDEAEGRQGLEQQGRKSAAADTLEECSPAPAEDMTPVDTAWTTFVAHRAELLQEAIVASVLTGKFNDVEIHAYTRRGSKSGQVKAPTAVHARASFLEASSPAFKEFIQEGKREPRLIPFVSDDYDYTDDSDLEDDEDDHKSELYDAESDVSFDFFDSPGLHSFDLARTPTPTPVVDKPEKTDESRFSTPTPAVDTPDEARDEVIFTSYGAARTWQVLIMYLQSDMVLKFNRLNSSFVSREDQLSCSPKSMYRLATKLQLPQLVKLSGDAIVADLTLGNIVLELFSDFTWRYPDILNREVAFFREHAHNPCVRADLKRAFEHGAMESKGVVGGVACEASGESPKRKKVDVNKTR